jgi:hypothetical protein
MPLNNMKTWADGELVTAAQMNSEIRDSVNTLTPGHQVLTTTQKNALTGVTTGTMVYDSTLNVLQYWNGTAWVGASMSMVPPLARVRRATTQSIPNSSDSFVTWTIEDIDTNNMFSGSVGSPSDTITIQTTGAYMCSMSVMFATNGTGGRGIGIMKNPSSAADAVSIFTYAQANPAASTPFYTLSCSGIASFTAGQTVKAYVTQNSGAALNIGDTQVTSATQLSVAWLGRVS